MPAVLLQQVVRNAEVLEQMLMVLIHLTATQPQLEKLPKSVLKVQFKPLCGTITNILRILKTLEL